MTIHNEISQVMQDFCLHYGTIDGDMKKLGVLLDEEGSCLSCPIDRMVKNIEKEGNVGVQPFYTEFAECLV